MNWSWCFRPSPTLLDPPIEPPDQNRVAPGLTCPECGEADADRLIWLDGEFVRCDACGTIYPPAG